jgi:hypothetical protein
VNYAQAHHNHNAHTGSTAIYPGPGCATCVSASLKGLRAREMRRSCPPPLPPPPSPALNGSGVRVRVRGDGYCGIQDGHAPHRIGQRMYETDAQLHAYIRNEVRKKEE